MSENPVPENHGTHRQAPEAPSAHPAPLEIRDEMIRLGQALKLASLVEDGADARVVIEAGLVQVNGDPETRRGRKLRYGDVIEFSGEAVKVVPEGH